MIEKIKKMLITSLIVLMLAPNVSAASFIDMPTKDHWSREGLEEAVHNGLLQGYKGKIYPDKALTRAEFAAVMTRALGLSEQANISKYKDVPKGEWYHDDMARAVYAGIFEGDHDRLHPERNVTREEAFTALGRSFILEGETNRLNRFKDGNQVANWAQYRINGLIDGAYISGDHLGRLNPRKQITRAEFSKIMDNVVKEYVTRPGVYNSLSERGNILVNRPGVTLKDMTLKGDLVIADGVADDEVTLSNMDMRGRLVLRGSSKLNIINNSRIEEALVVNKLGESYVYIEKGSRVNFIVLKSKTQIVGDGRVDKIHVSKDADGSKIEVDGAEVTVDEGANDVTDKHGDQIKPGGTTDLDQGGEDSKAEALARLIDLRREAGKMRNTDLTAVVNQYSKVNDKSSIAEINRAINAIERKIEEVRRAIIARLKSYEKPIEAEVRKIPKQQNPANLEREVNRVLRTYIKSPVKAQAQYVLVESKMEITLEESTVEHKFGIKLGDKDFVDADKVSLRQRLEKAIEKTRKMNDEPLNKIVREEEYRELSQKLYREETSVTESPTNITEVVNKVVSLEERIEAREREIKENLKKIGSELAQATQEFENIDNDQTLEEYIKSEFLKLIGGNRFNSAAEMTKYDRKDGQMMIFITLEEAGISEVIEIGLKNIPELDVDRMDKITELKYYIKETKDGQYGEKARLHALDYDEKNWARADLDEIEKAIDTLEQTMSDYSASKEELTRIKEDLSQKVTEKVNGEKLQKRLSDKISSLGMKQGKKLYELDKDINENLNTRLHYLLGKSENDGGKIEPLLASAEEILKLDKDKNKDEISNMWLLLKKTEIDIIRLEEDIKEVEKKIDEIDGFRRELPGKIKERAKNIPSSEKNLKYVVETELGDYKVDSIDKISKEGNIYKLTITGLRLDWDWKKDGVNYVIKLSEKNIEIDVKMQQPEDNTKN